MESVVWLIRCSNWQQKNQPALDWNSKAMATSIAGNGSFVAKRVSILIRYLNYMCLIAEYMQLIEKVIISGWFIRMDEWVDRMVMIFPIMLNNLNKWNQWVAEININLREICTHNALQPLCFCFVVSSFFRIVWLLENSYH